MLIVCVCGDFIALFFFLVVAVSDLVILLGLATDNVFSSVKKLMLIPVSISFFSPTVLNG